MSTRNLGFAATALTGALVLAPRLIRQAPAGWSGDFSSERNDLASRGTNPYFVLEPGYALTLEAGGERLTILVKEETRVIDGVETRLVIEEETRDGVPVEISRNYYAISRRTNNVYYFGEEVDTYTQGKITGHEGSWFAGEHGATFGLMMPGLPLLGARYYQEVAPRLAMDRAQVIAVDEKLTVPAGTFTGVLHTLETSPIEPGAKEAKYYAPGVGLLQDGSLKLVRHGMTGAPAGQ